MKTNKIIFSLTIIFLIFMASLVQPNFSYAEKVFRLASGEWTPFTSEHLKHYGVANHIVQEAFKLVGVKVEFGFFPWARSLYYVQEGEWDGTGFWSPNTEWQDTLSESDPIGEIKFVFFHRKDNPFDWESVDDLINNKVEIGLTIGYNYENPDFKREYSGGGRLEKRVQWATSDELNFKKLLRKRIDVFIQEYFVGYDMMKSMFPPEEYNFITHHPTPLTVTPAVLLLSKKVKKNERMLQLFNQGLQQLKESGRYDQFWQDSLEGKYKLDTTQ